MRVLVTGAGGFIGAWLCRTLRDDGLAVLAVVRDSSAQAGESIAWGDLASVSDLTPRLRGVDAVVHLAGRAHVLRDAAPDPAAAFRAANVVATERLAASAREAGVRRFVFVSSIGVFGNSADHALTETDLPRPSEPYAVSKLEAEQRLLEILHGSGVETVIVRPPLVYGPHCPGNLARLIRLARSGLPLPLGRFDAQRSFIGVQNLCSLLHRLVTVPQVGNEVFVAADGDDVTLAQLLAHIYAGLGMRPRLVPIPSPLVRAAARVLGFGATLERLTAPLRVDASKARTVLRWLPPMTAADGLQLAAASFRVQPK